MYFAVLGKNPELSSKELEGINATDISYPKKWIIAFDTIYPDKLSHMGWCIKIGTIVPEKELPQYIADTKIIGIQSEANGKHLKRTIGIKRYKLVDILHTDKEIKNKGKELINIDNGWYGIVEWYQNIELYESIDFDKPGRSMKMGMMPAKLTHIMTNIWINSIGKTLTPIVIYDPFVWSGTTGMIANYLWYDFVGSDIKTTYADQNMQRWTTTSLYNPEHSSIIVTHDINNTSEVMTLPVQGKSIVIVTEWWLGPIVTKSTSDQDIQKFQEWVSEIYQKLLDTTKQLKATTVCSIPRYIQQENGIEKILLRHATQIGLKIEIIPEIYARPGQQVGRKILIIK